MLASPYPQKKDKNKSETLSKTGGEKFFCHLPQRYFHFPSSRHGLRASQRRVEATRRELEATRRRAEARRRGPRWRRRGEPRPATARGRGRRTGPARTRPETRDNSSECSTRRLCVSRGPSSPGGRRGREPGPLGPKWERVRDPIAPSGQVALVLGGGTSTNITGPAVPRPV